MKYNIIGDIHGRTVWKDLVREDCINIFVGDYFSPYHNFKFEDMVYNFMEIIRFKMEHPETILLIGNHDEDHWHINERYSRYDSYHFHEIKQLFEENKDYFQMAYSIENKVLVTHAGVSRVWYERYKNEINCTLIINCNVDPADEAISAYSGKPVKVYGAPFLKYSEAKSPEEAHEMHSKNYDRRHQPDYKYNGPIEGDVLLWKNNAYVYNKGRFEIRLNTPDEVAEFVNEQWLKGKYSEFNFRDNCDWGDTYGESSKQGPIWIRPQSLLYTNIFKFTDFWQVVGHSMNKTVMVEKDYNLVFVDCLEYSAQSVIYDSEKNEFEINRIENNKENDK